MATEFSLQGGGVAHASEVHLVASESIAATSTFARSDSLLDKLPADIWPLFGSSRIVRAAIYDIVGSRLESGCDVDSIRKTLYYRSGTCEPSGAVPFENVFLETAEIAFDALLRHQTTDTCRAAWEAALAQAMHDKMAWCILRETEAAKKTGEPAPTGTASAACRFLRQVLDSIIRKQLRETSDDPRTFSQIERLLAGRQGCPPEFADSYDPVDAVDAATQYTFTTLVLRAAARTIPSFHVPDVLAGSKFQFDVKLAA